MIKLFQKQDLDYVVEKIREKINKNNSPSLDRIIPSKGYVIGNVMVISDLMNRMKQDSTFEDIEKLYNFYKKIIKNDK